MDFLEYDKVDPLGVLRLNLLSLGYALTPELVELIRQKDPRPLPGFAVYAVEDGVVAGQVGLFRLPMMSTEGPEDVGGAWAVCTHPTFSNRGIATRLLEEAHRRMRSAGLRFSTLATSRHRAAYSLYRRLGYEDACAFASAFAQRDALQAETDLHAELAGSDRLHLADGLFRQVAAGRLGFARRHEPFFPTMVAVGSVNVGEVWLLIDKGEVTGYALAGVLDGVLGVTDLLVLENVDVAGAVAALTRELKAPHVCVRVRRSSEIASLREAGYQIAQPDWSVFMVKPLTAEATMHDARRLFGLDTEDFLISWMDTT